MKVAAGLLIFTMLALFIGHKHYAAKPSLSGKNLALGPESLRPALPKFNLTLENQMTVSISNYKARVLHLVFWAEWCAPCTTELPFLESVAKSYSENEYKVILINLDTTSDALARAKKMQQNLSPSLEAVYQNTDELKSLFNIGVLPYHYLIDDQRRIASAFYSGLEGQEESFKEVLAQLIYQNSPNSPDPSPY